MPIERFYRNYFDWLFAEFPSKTDSNKLDGITLDAHIVNVIVNEQGFHFVDRDVIYSEDVNKSLLLWYMFRSSSLFYHFMNYYKLPPVNEDLEKTHPCLNQNTEDMKKAAKANENLLKKYFSNVGLIPHASFNLNFEILDADCPIEIAKEIDTEWYKKTYPDCTKSAVVHYMTIGWKKGYNPSPNFDAARYLTDYPDIATAKINPLEHYVLHGKGEGRQIHPIQPK